MRARLDQRGSEPATRQPLHVLFLNTRDQLGADVAVHLTLARALDRSRTRVWAATSTYEAPGTSTRAALATIPGLTVLPIYLGRPLTGRRGRSRLAALLGNVRAGGSLVRLAWLCRRESIDVIHVTERPRDMAYGLLLSRLAGSACLIHAHTSYYRHDASRFGTWQLRRAQAVVGVSRFTASTYVRDAGVASRCVLAVHNAVDDEAFTPDIPAEARSAMRARLGIPADVPVIGCVARLSRWKDQATLIDAFAAVRRALPEARLVLAGANTDSAPDGQGEYKDYLARRCAALKVAHAVIFAGFIPQADMPCLYAALDVLAHPAVEEPFGLAIVEAMASARPVVASNAGGIPEIIRDGVDGLLVPPGQADALAAALARVLREPHTAERLALAGRARVQAAFRPARQAHDMLAVYRRIARERGGGSRAAPDHAQRTPTTEGGTRNDSYTYNREAAPEHLARSSASEG